MVDGTGRALSGLRERKKQRTRATLIDAAMELGLKQGYEQTTVEQIAAAADVSPRTFSRYFATKDAVYLTLIEEYSDAVASDLESIPSEVGPLEAIRQAHVGVLTRVIGGQIGRLSAERIVLMLRVINNSDALRRSAFEFRHGPSHVLLAKRMGVDIEDRSVNLVMALFASVIVTACGDLIDDTDTVRLGPMVMVDRINEAFGLVAEFASDLALPPKDQPPASAAS